MGSLILPGLANGSLPGPKSVEDVRQFLAEATFLPVLGLQFQRSPAGYLTLTCEYKTRKGETRKKTLALGSRLPSLSDEVVDLTVIMSEWMAHGEGHMLDLLDATRTPEPEKAN